MVLWATPVSITAGYVPQQQGMFWVRKCCGREGHNTNSAYSAFQADTTAASQATPDMSSHSLLSFCKLGGRRIYLTVAVYSAWLPSTASLGFVSLPPGLQHGILLQSKRETALPLTDLSSHTLFAEHTWVSDLFQRTPSSHTLLMLCPSCQMKGVLVENHWFTKSLTDFRGKHRSPEKHIWPIQHLHVPLSCTTQCALNNCLKDVLQAAMGC